MRAVLDTNVLVGGAAGLPDYELAVASLSWAELHYGVRKAPTAIERARRESRLVRLRAVFGPGLAFDDAAAQMYETVCGLVLDHGRDVRGRVVDLMIAATAAAHGAAIITRNADDFVGLGSLIEVIVAS